MPNILDIRRRIRSVINTRQITKAMKMVSAARLRRAQERALAARPYAQMLTNVLKSLVARAEIYDAETGEPKHPLLAQRPENNILLIVVSGDKGLAGAFNANITKAAARFLASKQGKKIDIEAVGRKGRDFLRRRYPAATVQTQSVADLAESMEEDEEESGERAGEIQIIGEHVGILGKVEFAQASALAKSIIERYKREEIDAVYIVFNEFKSVIAQRLIVERILPIGEIGGQSVEYSEEMTAEEKKKAKEAAVSAGVGMRGAEPEAATQFGTSQVDYIYEQSPEELFRSLLPKYVSIQIFRALMESVAAEHAARMTAMDSATNNASDMIDSLTLVMNRARQAKITKEIIEIVSGAAAM
ncbi:MAG TPA: FoF1 ATP synthase subunit gamma [Candidatus Sulfotelmatobacter sp.]|nr:FoF1 ATP synthase subunit gamma [Candidatus Sulfotelmatobacter sp.]